MLSKIKDNLGLIATAIALMGSIGAGLSTATEIVDTLKGIDNRMNQVEVDFEMLKETTFVQGDIAVLFEKVQKLEITNDTNQYVQIEWYSPSINASVQFANNIGFFHKYF